MLHIPVCEYLILKMNMQVITTKVRCSEMHGERAAAAGGQSTVHLAPRDRVLAVADDVCGLVITFLSYASAWAKTSPGQRSRCSVPEWGNAAFTIVQNSNCC